MKIAIVDDDPIARQILRSSLSRLGVEVVEYSDGSSAWEDFSTLSPRFVITDWLMPEMDGLDLIRNIRSTNFNNYTYTIILTGKEDITDVISGLTSGADDYLTKPFDFAELKARVQIGLRILALEDDLIRAREQMERMTMYDYLTGLLSRRAVYAHLQGETERVNREGRSLSIMMLDLNNFKALNETYGHIVGDQALLLAAEQITQSVRPYDWAARWGDDEFLVVLPHTDVIQAEAIGNRILSRIRKISISVPEKETLQINASIGIITTSKINDGIDLIIQSANEVLNSAKNGGNDCIFVRDLQSLAK
jgi:two-component system chemotaxis response regulator CheY